MIRLFRAWRARRAHEARVRVARVLLRAPDDRHYVFDVWRLSFVNAAKVYQIMWQWLGRGWLEDGWEPEQTPGRPRRRWYRLTDNGMRALLDLVDSEPN